MTTTEAAFYDATMTETLSPAMLDLSDSPWLPLYQEAASWMPANHPVVDLGTGTGRFPHMLYNTHHYGAIVGVDFSEAALAEASAYFIANTVPHISLRHEDLRDWHPAGDRDGNTSYTCLEVLEHLDDDLDLVRRVPPGHQFVFSVPNYESESHVRVFRNAGDVWARYAHLLEFRRWTLIHVDGTKAIHVCDTFRRSDCW